METNNKPEPPKRKTVPFLAISFFYLVGFMCLRREHDTATNKGILLLTIGWLFIGLSILLSVLVFIRLFKEQFKRK